MIMTNTTAQQRFSQVFTTPPGTYGDSTEPGVRGAGLPPPPPIARDALSGVSTQRLFVDVFGEGEGLATEMLIMGDRHKRDLFTAAFSQFLKENILRAAEDKRTTWEDDMMQLMTDALGDDGPALLRDIFADPQRATLFRQAFAGYLEERPTTVATLLETEEGSSAVQRQVEAALEKKELKAKADLDALIGVSTTTAARSAGQLPSARRVLPIPV